MTNEIIVSVLEYLDIFRRRNAFDHCLEVVLRKIDIP